LVLNILEPNALKFNQELRPKHMGKHYWNCKSLVN